MGTLTEPQQNYWYNSLQYLSALFTAMCSSYVCNWSVHGDVADPEFTLFYWFHFNGDVKHKKTCAEVQKSRSCSQSSFP